MSVDTLSPSNTAATPPPTMALSPINNSNSNHNNNNSSPILFMTCSQLREAFAKCPDDINKRILIIDVRHPSLYAKSHLCLDIRNEQISSIKTKMRVMNLDPDQVGLCTSKQLMTLLNGADLKVFSRRKDATDVVIIDNHTDEFQKLQDPRSKVMRIIKALTTYDNTPDEKIVVPIHVLQGGYRGWLLTYPHFTTDSTFDPDTCVEDLQSHPSLPSSPAAAAAAAAKASTKNNHIALDRYQPPTPGAAIVPQAGALLTPTAPVSTSLQPTPFEPHNLPLTASQAPFSPPTIVVQPNRPPPISPKPTLQSKPVVAPQRPIPTAPKPNIVKNAPGTAVPVTPNAVLRPPLPRSHSSPNVAQPDGDEFDLDSMSNQLNSQKLQTNAITTYNNITNTNHLYSNHTNANATQLGGLTVNNNHLSSHQPSQVIIKPRFDRTLKPTLNSEAINAIRAQLNFGRSPEASGKAISGLQNLGNTCFMNSVIQCLAYVPTLVSYFCNEAYYNLINFQSQDGTKGELAIEFGALIEKLNSHRYRYIEPKSFREAIVKHTGFAGNEQQDSHEFMMMLFDKLHHDLNVHAKDKFKQNGILQNGNSNCNDETNINIARATLGYQFWKRHLEMNKSVISDLFEGIFMSTLTCTFCKGQSNTFEVFNCLSLPIPSESRCHLRDCLNHFSNPERIEAAWECPRCKVKREADKKIVICKLPRILIIHLKRFSLDGRWRQKLSTFVDFPLNDLTVNSTNVLPQSAYDTPLRSSYSLFAVVNHYGHLDGGHYTAYGKLENQRWYTFEDSNVSEMRDSDVCSQAAYILFYTCY